MIDAPNQQGQDANHLPAIIAFLVKSRPPNAQLILAVEEAAGVDGTDVQVVAVGQAKDQLLSEAAFAQVSDHLRPFMAQTVLSHHPHQ